jgi:hypothetical protein
LTPWLGWRRHWPRGGEFDRLLASLLAAFRGWKGWYGVLLLCWLRSVWGFRRGNWCGFLGCGCGLAGWRGLGGL